jgi:hypothetical protein
MRDSDATPGKDDVAPAAGEAPGAGRGGDDCKGVARGVATGAYYGRQEVRPVGILQKPAATDTCEVLGSDPAQYRVTFTYTNHRGEISVRLVIPQAVIFGHTRWHPKPQWLLEAFDCQKNAPRSFAMKDISDWEPAP